MRSWMIAFCTGAILGAWSSSLPSTFALVIAVLPVIVCLRYRRSRLLGSFLLGLWWVAWEGRSTLDEWWPVSTQPSEVWAEGIVWSLPLPTAQGNRFQFKLERLCQAPTLDRCSEKGWEQDSRLLQLSTFEAVPLVPGERWRWQLRLRRPHGYANPGAYDYEAWLLQQRIAAIGYVRSTKTAVLLDANSGRRSLERIRHHGLQTLLRSGEGLTHLPLIIALTLGEGSRIAPRDWELFNRTGTSHLVVISGSHITLVAGLCLWLMRHLWCFSSRLPLLWPAPFPAACAALLGAWGYTALAGFNLPAQRALTMSALTLGAILLRRHTAPWHILLVALVTVLALDPLASQLPGFWLSFAAVAVLTLVLLRPGQSSGWRQRIWQLVRSQGYISIALLPLTGLLFQQMSWVSPLINLVAIPLVGFIAVPLSLLSLALAVCAPSWAVPVLQLTDFLLTLLLEGLRRFDAWTPSPLLTLPRLSFAGNCALVVLTLAMLLARRTVVRFSLVLSLPVLLVFRAPLLPSHSARITVIDVGQGNAILVSTRHHHLLYDTGPRYSDRFEAGSASVMPVLRYYGVTELDQVIVSHADSDHAGGLEAVFDAHPNSQYLGSDTSVFSSSARQMACSAEQRWQWDGVTFEIISPRGNIASRNDGSCVLRINVGSQVVLLTGDIEREREHRLLQDGLVGPVSLLMAPHHGSNTSSSPAFVTALQPRHVVYTTGYLNRYGHPAGPVTERYTQAGTTQWYTMRSGALQFIYTADSAGPVVSEYRVERPRFWGAPLL